MLVVVAGDGFALAIAPAALVILRAQVGIIAGPCRGLVGTALAGCTGVCGTNVAIVTIQLGHPRLTLAIAALIVGKADVAIVAGCLVGDELTANSRFAGIVSARVVVVAYPRFRARLALAGQAEIAAHTRFAIVARPDVWKMHATVDRMARVIRALVAITTIRLALARLARTKTAGIAHCARIAVVALGIVERACASELGMAGVGGAFVAVLAIHHAATAHAHPGVAIGVGAGIAVVAIPGHVRRNALSVLAAGFGARVAVIGAGHGVTDAGTGLASVVQGAGIVVLARVAVVRSPLVHRHRGDALKARVAGRGLTVGRTLLVDQAIAWAQDVGASALGQAGIPSTFQAVIAVVLIRAQGNGLVIDIKRRSGFHVVEAPRYLEERHGGIVATPGSGKSDQCKKDLKSGHRTSSGLRRPVYAIGKQTIQIYLPGYLT